MPDTQAPDPSPPPGTPLDEGGRPRWVDAHLTPDQRDKLLPGLVWMLLLYQQAGLDPSRINVAQRIYIGASGGRDGWHWESSGQRRLAADLGMSQPTLVAALDELARFGWLIPVTRGRKGAVYVLAWPPADCLTPVAGKARCGQPTGKGNLCTTTAGKGTVHPGEGPCYKHGGTRKNQPEPADQLAGEASPLQPLKQSPAAAQHQGDAALQPLNQTGPETDVEIDSSTTRPHLVVLQPLKRKPVDNPDQAAPYQPPLLQPLKRADSTVEAVLLQPLEPTASTVESRFVGFVEGFVTCLNEGSPRSTSGGSPPRRPDGTFNNEAAAG